MTITKNLADFTSLTTALPNDDTLKTEVQAIVFATAVFTGGISHKGDSDDWVFEFSPDPTGADLTLFDAVIAAHTGVPILSLEEELLAVGVSSEEIGDALQTIVLPTIESKAIQTNATNTYATKLSAPLFPIDATFVVSFTGIAHEQDNADYCEVDVFEVGSGTSLLLETIRVVKGIGIPQPQAGFAVTVLVDTLATDSPTQVIGLRFRTSDTGGSPEASLSHVTMSLKIQR